MLRAAFAAMAATLCVAACAPPEPIPVRYGEEPSVAATAAPQHATARAAPAAASQASTTPAAAAPAATTGVATQAALPAVAAAAVGSSPAAPGGSAVARALAASDRPADETAQDNERQSAVVLAFSGVKPGDAVLDLGARQGYMTWLLSGVVGAKGSVIAQNPQEWFASIPDLGPKMNALRAARSNVTHRVMPFDKLDVDAGSVDAVIASRVYHDVAYMDVDRIWMNQQIYGVLKPGGVYIVVDYRARQGSGVKDAKALHRVEPMVVQREAENAGFHLQAESDVLTHKEDDLMRDALDPVLRGRANEFVMKFVKPAT
jgi:predicted methyltransferase